MTVIESGGVGFGVVGPERVSHEKLAPLFFVMRTIVLLLTVVLGLVLLCLVHPEDFEEWD
jgi:hypothetical protein